MTFGKRQLVIAALVTALGTAVYLNWQFSGVEPVSVNDVPETSSVSKQLGQTTYVNTEVSDAEMSKPESKAETKKTAEVSQVSQSPQVSQALEDKTTEVTSRLSKEQQSYFSSERAKREQLQDQAAEALSDMIESASTSETAKKDAVKAAEKIAESIKVQGDIEAEIKTKGFEECLVSINNTTCTVIVPKGNLNDATAITIKDIVNRQAGIAFDKITVTEI